MAIRRATKRLRKGAWGAVFSLVLASGLALGCGEANEHQWSSELPLEAAVSFDAHGADLVHLFSPDPDGLGHVIQGIAADDTGFDRLSLMVDSEGEPALDVRVSQDGGAAWSVWYPTEVYFSEGIFHNAHADIPHGGTHVEIRLRDPAPDRLSFLLLEGFTFKPEIDEGASDDPGLGSRSQALAGTDIIDVSRSGWGAASGRCTAASGVNRITVHHTDTPNGEADAMPARMRQIQSQHMHSRGFCDIGYHFLVGQDGRVYEGRVETLRGAHVEDQNTGNAGVAFIGNYVASAPSAAMMNNGTRVLSAIACHYGVTLDRDTVQGHSERAATECPGLALFNRMDGLVEDAAAISCDGSDDSAIGTAPPTATDPAETTGSFLLRGVVHEHGDSSAGIARASVRVAGRQAFTSGSGYFSVLVPAGTHDITASAAGYDNATRTRQVTPDDAAWVSIGLRPEQQSAQTGELVGVVFEAPDSSRRLAGAKVRLSNGASTVTNSNGYFSLGVPGGSYTVTVSMSGYQTATVSRQVTTGSTTWGCVGLRRLDSRGVLSGVVYEEPYTNRRIAGAEVRLSSGHTTLTDADGAFSFEVAPGTYRVSASVQGFAASTVVRTVADGEEVTASIGLSVLDSPVGEIVGVVFADPDMAERIEGAQVFTSSGESTYTDQDGIYRLSGVREGQVTIYAGAAGYRSGSAERHLSAGKELWVSIGLTPDGEEDEEPSEDGIRAIAPIDGALTGSNPEFEWENITAEQADGADFSYRVVVINREGTESHEGVVAPAIAGTSRSSIGLSLSQGEWRWAVYAICDNGDLIASSAMNDFEVR